MTYISERSLYDGEAVKIGSLSNNFVNSLYFNNVAEWIVFIDIAEDKGLIKKLHPLGTLPKWQLTINGMNRVTKSNESTNSKLCFIAMAFPPDMYVIADEVIKPAVKACGFVPYIVSDQHMESDQTINDGILVGIKKARFTIADFTYHRGGVYFEAGYALGRGQQVIYTCREDEMGKAHFDIRNYQHIVWTNAADFQIKLINKIEAFIKD